MWIQTSANRVELFVLTLFRRHIFGCLHGATHWWHSELPASLLVDQIRQLSVLRSLNMINSRAKALLEKDPEGVVQIAPGVILVLQ